MKTFNLFTISSLFFFLSVVCKGQTIEWTWKKGSNERNERPTSGTKGVANSANTPGARSSAICWNDSAGNLWLFGGYGLDRSYPQMGVLDDMWKFDGESWTWIAGHEDISTYNVADYGTKGVSASTNYPGARTSATAITDNNGIVWMFGGSGFDQTRHSKLLNELWKWDGSNWTWVSGDKTGDQAGIYGTGGVYQPGSRWASYLWCDSNNNLYLFGGEGYDESGVRGHLNDLWKWDGTNWSLLWGEADANHEGVYHTIGVPNTNSTFGPGGRSSGGSWVDTSGNLWLLGGEGYDCDSSLNQLCDLWKWDGSYWTWMKGAKRFDQGVFGPKGIVDTSYYPGSRTNLNGVTDSEGNYWLFGGKRGIANRTNDLWRFDGVNWALISGSQVSSSAGDYGTINTSSMTNIPGGRAVVNMWIKDNKEVWIMGGYGRDGSNRTGRLNDLWKGELKYIWKGNSTSWSDTSNWHNRTEPNNRYKIYIPASLSNFPSVNNDTELGDIEIEDGASLSIASGKKLSLSGDLTHLGTTANNFGNGTLEFVGTSTQTISGPITANVIVNNSNDISIGSDCSIGDLTLTSGDIDIGDNDLTLTGTIGSGNSNSYIKISGTGKVKATVGTSPITLPIGRNPYEPIIIDDGGGAVYTVGLSENVFENPENETSLMSTLVVGETWTIQASSAQTGVSVTLQWNESEEEASFDRANCMVAYWEEGVSTAWNADGTLASASGSDPYSISRTIDFTTNLYYFGVGGSGSVLPVELTYFEATWIEEGKSAQLNWQTATEENNSHFEVERSFDGSNWTQIVRVDGAGNSISAKVYSYVDKSPILAEGRVGMGQTVYYRLKQVDYDGAFDFSEVRTLNNEELTISGFSVYPNPSKGCYLNFTIPGNYTLYNADGQLLLKVNETNKMDISSLPNAVYFIINENGDTIKYIKNNVD